MNALPPRDLRAGFTIIEVMVVALIIVGLTSVALASNRESPHRLVYHAAQQLRAQASQAILEADAQSGDAFLLASAAVAGQVRGSFLATVDTQNAPESEVMGRVWTPLADGVQWGGGDAALGPLGDSVGGGNVPLSVRCPAGRGCLLGLRGTATYYLTHARDASAVSAVVLTPEGIVHLYRYLPAAAAWTTEAPR